MRKHLLAASMLCLLLANCTKDKIHVETTLDRSLTQALHKASITVDKNHFILPESDDFTAIPQDKAHNPLTKEKVELGKLLFYETGIALSPSKNAGQKTYSCASCHVPSAGFRPGSVQGIADGGIGFGINGENRAKLAAYEEEEMDVQGVRPLSVLNVAFVENTTWNGRFGSAGVNIGTEDRWEVDAALHINAEGFAALESQNIEGLEVHRMEITAEVLDDYGYRPYFDAAFGKVAAKKRYSKTNAAFAISAYLRTLLANEAPFQSYLKGTLNAMSEQEKRGALVFFTDAKCFHCHKEKNLGANDFYALGVNDLYQTGLAFNTSAEDQRNLGRGEYSGRAIDNFKFKIPQLYNLADAPFYFHGSSKTTLAEVVNYFNKAIPENSNVPKEQIARQFQPLQLPPQQVVDLTAFLETGLRDPNLERYVPEQILSGFCFPNNDLFSQLDLGCGE
ncbi:MAG: cytochrome-c peroxidase [Saprospiraceae bacterium]